MAKTIFTIVSLLILTSTSFAKDPSAKVQVKLSPAGSFEGVTAQVKGEAIQDGDSVRAENIVVTLADLKTGVALRDEHTLKHLQTKEYPTAVLIKATGKDGKGQGTIKIKGIEKPVEGTYKVDGNTLEANFKLKLADFKITGIKYMGIGVRDEVTISVTVPLKKKDAKEVKPVNQAKK